MNMKILIAHLEKINAKIQAAKPFNEESYDDFIQLVCNDFFEKIIAEPETREWFEEKLFYMRTLAGSGKIISIQKQLLANIAETKTLLCKRSYIERLFKEKGTYSYVYFNNSPYDPSLSEKQHINVLYHKMEGYFDVTRYVPLEYGKDPPYAEKISSLVPACGVLEQYRNFQYPVRCMAYFHEVSSKSDREKLKSLLAEYNTLLEKLTGEVEKKPLRLHLKSFEDTAILHSEYSPVDSYFPDRVSYGLRAYWNSLGKLTVSDTKKDIDVILDELKLDSESISQEEELPMFIQQPAFDPFSKRKALDDEMHKSALHQAQLEEKQEAIRQDRERTRLARIAASGKLPILYSIDSILQQCILNRGREKVEIDFYTLGFEDHYMNGLAHGAHKLFLALQNAGAFTSVERVNYTFVVTGINIEKIKSYRSSLEAELMSTSGEAISGSLDERGHKKIHDESLSNNEGYLPRDDDIVLDENILLGKPQQRDNYLLAGRMENGKYSQKEKISPLAAYILDHLYRLSPNTPHGKTRKNIASSMRKTPGALSNARKDLEKLCERLHIKQLIYTDPEDLWVLHSDLTCRTPSRSS